MVLGHRIQGWCVGICAAPLWAQQRGQSVLYVAEQARASGHLCEAEELLSHNFHP